MFCFCILVNFYMMFKDLDFQSLRSGDDRDVLFNWFEFLKCS